MWPFKKKDKKAETPAEALPEKTYAQYREEFRQLEVENSEMEDQCARDGSSWQDMLIKTRDIKEKMAHADKMMRKLQEPALIYNKKWKGRRLPLDDFISASTAKEITDTSGEGYYATETAKTDIRIYPSDVLENIYRTDFPYVLWFGKE